jgi:hypothetical protein
MSALHCAAIAAKLTSVGSGPGAYPVASVLYISTPTHRIYPCCTYGPRAPASGLDCVLCVYHRRRAQRAACPQGPTHCRYAVRAPAALPERVPYVYRRYTVGYTVGIP